MSKTSKPTSPSTAAVAAGLFAALASSYIVPPFWAAMETSSELTFGVMLVVGVLAALSTYWLMKQRVPKG
jgi:hypothetical protein